MQSPAHDRSCPGPSHVRWSSQVACSRPLGLKPPAYMACRVKTMRHLPQHAFTDIWRMPCMCRCRRHCLSQGGSTGLFPLAAEQHAHSCTHGQVHPHFGCAEAGSRPGASQPCSTDEAPCLKCITSDHSDVGHPYHARTPCLCRCWQHHPHWCPPEPGRQHECSPSGWVSQRVCGSDPAPQYASAWALPACCPASLHATLTLAPGVLAV